MGDDSMADIILFSGAFGVTFLLFIVRYLYDDSLHATEPKFRPDDPSYWGIYPNADDLKIQR
jgi:hypothetical protein